MLDCYSVILEYFYMVNPTRDVIKTIINEVHSRSPSLRSLGRNVRLWDNPFQGGI
jgi:hypothetical protein